MLALAAACNAPAREYSRPSSAPSQAGREPRVIASDLFLCPGGFAFPAYGRVFYLPNDPKSPDASVRPTRCFATSDEARSAGFRLAPGALGSEVIGDI